MISEQIAFLWLGLGIVVGLIIGRMIANADRRLPEQDGQYGGECDGRVEQFHADRNHIVSEQHHA